ncbi:MAG: apolipoprotein N-acyltransferase, partial [Woeseiaceae bacterium]
MSSKFPLEAWAEHRPWLTRFAYFLIGVMMTLSFAPFGYYLLAPILLLPLLYAFLRLAPAVAARLGASFGAGLFLAGTYWLYVSIHVFGQAPLILALALMLGLVIIMSLYYAATGWMLAHCRGLNLWQFIILAPAIWVFNEWLRGWVLSGFPWMTLGYSQVDSTLSAMAPVLGVYGVSLALLVSASALLVGVLSTGSTRIACLSVAIVPWLAGIVLDGHDWTNPSGPTVRTTIVQGGVSQDRKWLPEQFETTLDLYRDSLLSNDQSELVVWPEVAIPSVADRVEGYIKQLELDLQHNRQTLLFG